MFGSISCINNIIMIIIKVLRKLRSLACRLSNKRFIKYLRVGGIQIGNGVKFRPFSTEIDLTRPSLVSIGDNCYFNKQFVLLTHDWVTRVFIYSGRDFLPSSGRVKIGNNVSTGQNVMILKGVTIGDNVFIGANSVVTKDIPSNSIAVGTPCKVIMSLDEYYNRRKTECIEEALDYARSIKERYNREPIVSDFREEFALFVDGDKIDDYPEISELIRFQLGPAYEYYKTNHKAKYNGFDDFLKAAGM